MKGYRFDLGLYEERKKFIIVPYYEYSIRVFGNGTGVWTFNRLFRMRGSNTHFKPTGNRPEERGYGPVQSMHNVN